MECLDKNALETERKAKKKAYYKAWIKENPTYHKKYQLDNKENINKQKKQYYKTRSENRANNIVKYKIYMKEYYKKNCSDLKIKHNIYRSKHKESMADYSILYRKENKNKIRVLQKKWWDASKSNLIDAYIRTIIRGRNENPDNYTPEMLDIVRQQILIYREIHK